jgi:Domain of unknown function (DUF4258)
VPFEPILQEFRRKIRQQAYIVTIHADEEMDDDCLAIADVETCILEGEILERQRDTTTGESKYRIRGYSLDGLPMETIAKLGASGKIIIITVYAL